MGRDFPDQNDPVRFLPFYLETAAEGRAFHELEVVGWSDDTARRTILRSIMRKLDGGVVACHAGMTDTQLDRALAAACGERWSGRSGDVFRRTRDALESGDARIILLEEAHHLAPRHFRSLQSLMHDTPACAVLASGSPVLFEKLWRAARNHPLLVYCRIHAYGVALPKPLLEYLQRRHAELEPLLRKKTPRRPRLRLRRSD